MMQELYAKGKRLRSRVLGPDYVQNMERQASELAQPFQKIVNEFCWGSIWSRPGLDLKTRSLCTVAMLVALKQPHELRAHIQGALNNGASVDEVREVLIHSMVYAGAPAAKQAFEAAEGIVNKP